MSLKRFFSTAATLILSGSFAIAQNQGFLRGNVSDGEVGGPMIGATVVLTNDPGVGVVTDFDGNYSLPLPPGTYSVRISFISFQTMTFPDVVIKDGEVTKIDAVLKSAIDELQVVEITETVRRNSETGVLLEMKNASNVVDGLSSQSIRKVGDSDLSGAIRRVTGVTVQAGKYVYVRGLGDRYSKTTLNGMSIPGLDPDVNAVQIDIFPTAVLENVAVYKTFTPNLYGDFTGGLVDIITKDFPEEKETQISLGLGFVPGQTFNDEFVLYDRGKLDWLGFDDGTRELPINAAVRIPDETTLSQSVEQITRAFSPNLAVTKRTAFLNTSLSARHGNQINKENGKTFGYNFVVNYNNNNNYYDSFQSNVFLKDNNRDNNNLLPQEFRAGVLATNAVQWSALASGAYKTQKSALGAMILRSQVGETNASKRISRDVEQTGATLVEDILTYTQRELTTLIVDYKTRVNKLQIDLANALSLSRVYDPDFRTTSISITTGAPTLITGDGAGINRFWRDLNEVNENFAADFTYNLKPLTKIRFGGNALMKWRQFETFAYSHDRRNRQNVDGNPDWFLQPENVWTADERSGTFTIGNFEPANSFDARQNVFAAYAMAEHKLYFDRLKAIYGLRMEAASMFYTGQDNIGAIIFDDQQTLDEVNFLPSANLVYALTEKINLRGSFSQTIARPSFKEKSIAQIFDPITKRTFVGNLDLNQTEINNYDFRFEWYVTPRELISVAAFYKQFDGHIELVAFEAAPDNFKPRNSGDATVLGVEFEIRKQLGFVVDGRSPLLNRLFLGGNVTIVQSQVDLKSVNTGNAGQTEFDLRTNNLRAGETLNQFRDMAGQSPYSINANLAYEILEKQLSVAVAYNVQGEQLTFIASGRNPDVYTVPFHSIDFNTFVSFGEGYRSRVSLSVQNILDEDRTLIYRSFGTDDEVFQSFKPGTTISAKYAYTF